MLPASGEPAWFEAAPDAQERPRRIAQFLKDRGGVDRIGIEERAAFATYDALSKLVKAEFVSADPVTIGCRVIKSPAELALMQRANDITIEAYRAAFQTLREGMTQGELSATHRRGLSADGRAGRGDGELWRVHGISAWQHPAAALARGRFGAGGRWLQRRRISIGHHAHHHLR